MSTRTGYRRVPQSSPVSVPCLTHLRERCLTLVDLGQDRLHAFSRPGVGLHLVAESVRCDLVLPCVRMHLVKRGLVGRHLCGLCCFHHSSHLWLRARTLTTALGCRPAKRGQTGLGRHQRRQKNQDSGKAPRLTTMLGYGPGSKGQYRLGLSSDASAGSIGSPYRERCDENARSGDADGGLGSPSDGGSVCVNRTFDIVAAQQIDLRHPRTVLRRREALWRVSGADLHATTGERDSPGVSRGRWPEATHLGGCTNVITIMGVHVKYRRLPPVPSA